MRDVMLSAQGRVGPEALDGDQVVVSATRFTYGRLANLLPVAWEARRLAGTWAHRAGAIGLLTAAQPLRRRTYSLSLWTSEEALRDFLQSPEHVRLVRAYGRRLVTSRSVVWRMDPAAVHDAWRIGRERLGA